MSINFTKYSVMFMLVFASVIPRASIAQSSNITIGHYTSNNGLPQNSILGILFDKNGYCWMSTEAGLVRYDGKALKTFGTDNILGLLDNRFRKLAITREGDILAVNLNRQIASTRPLGSLFAPRPVLLKNSNYYLPDAGYFTDNPSIGILWDSIYSGTNLPLLRTHFTLANGDTYCTNSKYLYQIGENSSRLIKTWDTQPLSTAPMGDYLLQLWSKNKIAVLKNGELLYEGKIMGDFKRPITYQNEVQKLLWCPTGTFIYLNGSLYQISFENNQLNAKEVLSGLSIKSVSSIYFTPKNKTYYIGTPTDGLYIVKRSDFYYPKLPANIQNNSVYAIGKTSTDALFMKDVYIPKDKPGVYIPLGGFPFRGYVDSLDRYYYQRGFVLYRYDVKKRENKAIMDLYGNIASILPTAQSGELLVCAGKSLSLLSKDQQVVWKKPLPIDYPRVNVNKMVHLEGSKYMLLTTKGAKWYDLATNTINRSLLDSENLSAFYKDSKGQFWFAADGLGVYLYSDTSLYKYPQSDLSRLNGVHAFIDDGQGFFWLSTNNGLFRVEISKLVDYLKGNRQDLFLYVMSSYEGLKKTEFNGSEPAYQWLSDSVLALPTMDGVAMFKPYETHINYPDNKILIDAFVVDSVDIRPQRLAGEISLDPNFNLLSLVVSCPYFGNPQNLKLEYCIHKVSSAVQWQALPSDGKLNINNLSSGDYEILFRKQGYEFSPKDPPLKIKFTVMPKFYNTWWFYGLSLLLITVICYSYFRYRLRRIKNENRRIEAIVNERTLKLKTAAEQLQSSEMALKQSNKQKELIITMVLHDLRSPLRFLKTVTSGIMNSYDQEMSLNLANSLRKLNGSALALWEFTDRFFTWAVTQQQDFEIEKTQFELQEVFFIVGTFYEEIVLLNNNRLKIQPTNLVCYTDKNMLQLIIRNLIDNANKNSMEGEIKLYATQEDGYVKIMVSDQGKGLSPEQVAMFTEFSGFKGSEGIGSQVIQAMLAKIGANLSIETSSKGSCFMISLTR